MAGVSEAPPTAPKWPEHLPEGQTRFTYDRESDTLFVDFYGEPRPASSEPVDIGDRDYLYFGVDPLTDEVVGVQVETFLSYAVERHPDFIEALIIADIKGYDDFAARELRQWAKAHTRQQTGAQGLINTMGRLGA